LLWVGVVQKQAKRPVCPHLMDMTVSDNLWVGDLPPEINEDTVKNIFEGYGTILSTKVIPPRGPGKNAAALIRYQSMEDARWVVENLNGNMPEGFTTPVVVQFAKNSGASGGSYGKAPAGGKGGCKSSPYADPSAAVSGSWGGGVKGKGKPAKAGNFKGYMSSLAKGGKLPGVGARPDEQCVHVKNLPPDTTDLQLYQLFSVFGPMAHNGVTAMMREDGACLGIGFIDFQDPASAAQAVEVLDGTAMPDGTVINMNLKRPRGKGKGKGQGAEETSFGLESGMLLSGITAHMT